MSKYRIVCGGKWTVDGRWVIVGSWLGHDNVILYDPDNGDPFCDIWDCRKQRADWELQDAHASAKVDA